MTRFMMLLFSVAVFLPPATAQDASPAQKTTPSFSVVRDFSAISNPNGAWSYGSSATLGGDFKLLPLGGGDCEIDFCGWGFGPSNLDPPSVLSNAYLKLIGVVELQPGPIGEYSVVRFTAPKVGKFNITGVFVGDRDCTTTDVHVLYDGVSVVNDKNVCLFDPSVFHFEANLKVGDTIDFAVANDSTLNDDATGLDVTIVSGSK